MAKRNKRKNYDISLEEMIKRDFPGQEIILTKHETSKLSDVLIEFASPMLGACKDYEQQKRTISLMIHVWNAAIESGNYLEKMLSIIKAEFKDKNPDYYSLTDDVIKVFLQRKKELFIDDRRFVVTYDITRTFGQLHLKVAYRNFK